MTAPIRAIAPVDEDPILQDEKLWQLVSTGDLAGLSAQQKVSYYQYKCRELGVSPAHQPFQFIRFQGKEILYGTKNLAEQLRGLRGVTFHDIRFTDEGDLMTYEGFVRTRDGREDYEVGVLAVAGLKGEARANAKMKCLTKFKRRATLSICGAGVPDETELEAGDRLERRTYPQQVVTIRPDVHDVDTGELEITAIAGGERVPDEGPNGEVVRPDGVIITPAGDISDKRAEDMNGPELVKDIKVLASYLGWSDKDVSTWALERSHDMRKRTGALAVHEHLTDMVAQIYQD